MHTHSCTHSHTHMYTVRGFKTRHAYVSAKGWRMPSFLKLSLCGCYYAYLCMFVCMCACMHVYVCVGGWVHACVDVCVCVCVCVYVYCIIRYHIMHDHGVFNNFITMTANIIMYKSKYKNVLLCG